MADAGESLFPPERRAAAKGQSMSADGGEPAVPEFEEFLRWLWVSRGTLTFRADEDDPPAGLMMSCRITFRRDGALFRGGCDVRAEHPLADQVLRCWEELDRKYGGDDA